MPKQKITPFLWFDNNAEEATNLYTSVFKNSKIKSKMEAGGNVMGVTFDLEGVEFTAFNGGPMFTFNESISMFVNCDTQEEVDYYWNALTANGGEESMCGWLKDKFGMSWQIVPSILGKVLSDPNPTKANAAMQAMLKMKKLNIAELQRGYDNA